VTAMPEHPADVCPPGRPDFYPIADYVLVGKIPAGGACTHMSPPQRRLLQPVWDGDSDKASVVERARAICQGCPALEVCRRYAADNLVEHGVLAGLTAAQRRGGWTRRDRIAWRRRRTRALYKAGATAPEMAEVLNTPQRTIEADIAALGLSGSRRRRRAP
jgi:hypothetical protein